MPFRLSPTFKPHTRVGPLAILALCLVGALFGFHTTPIQAVSPGYNGKIAFVSTRDGNDEIYVMNPDGSVQTRLTNNPATDKDPTWSPDGAKIAFRSNRDGNDEIYTMDADGGNQTRLTNDPATDGQPAWSPDGTKIAFLSSRDGNGEIYVMSADGGNQTRVTSNPATDQTPSWLPSGDRILFNSTRTGHTEIYAMDPDGGNVAQITNHTYSSSTCSAAPDGATIVYTDGGISGNSEVYRINLDGSGGVRLTNNPDNDNTPSFSPDGTTIAFVRNTGSINYVYTMKADGSAQTPLTTAVADGRAPQWQPIPNHAPIALAQSVSTPENTPVTADMFSSATDEEALSPANVAIAVNPAHGGASVDLATGIVTYTPSANFVGTDQLTYQVCDSFLLDQKCATAVLSITVSAPPPAPTPSAVPTIPPAGPPPALALTAIGELKTVNGATTYYYTGHRPTFLGTATAGAVITVEIHSSPITLTTMAGSDGTWSVAPDQDLPNGDHSVTITATKDGATTTLASLTLGINTGLAETGMPIWPLGVVGLMALLGARRSVRRHAA